MRLRRNEYCPIHRSLFCCGRELIPNKPRVIRLYEVLRTAVIELQAEVEAEVEAEAEIEVTE